MIFMTQPYQTLSRQLTQDKSPTIHLVWQFTANCWVGLRRKAHEWLNPIPHSLCSCPGIAACHSIRRIIIRARSPLLVSIGYCIPDVVYIGFPLPVYHLWVSSIVSAWIRWTVVLVYDPLTPLRTCGVHCRVTRVIWGVVVSCSVWTIWWIIWSVNNE